MTEKLVFITHNFAYQEGLAAKKKKLSNHAVFKPFKQPLKA